MRLKYDSEDSSAFTCCFCCHVRVGTILLGLFHLMLHLMVLGILVSTSLHPELLRNSIQPGSSMDTDGIIVYENEEPGKDGQEVVIQYDIPSFNTTLDMRKENLCLFSALVVCKFLVALMVVYGAVKSRPSCLMPFFCLQIFEFCMTCLSAVSFLSYAPDLKLWITQRGMSVLPVSERLIQMEERWLMLWLVIVFVLVLSIEAYLINMVWACNKYLQLRNANRSVVREYTTDPDSEMLLPPKYEEAIKMDHTLTPPPAYSA